MNRLTPGRRRIRRPGYLLLLPILVSLFTCRTLFAGDAFLSWAPNTEPNLAGYKIYYGTSPGIYGPPIDAGLTATPSAPATAVTGLGAGTFYFAVTALDTAGNESGFSGEVSKTLASSNMAPAADTTPPGDVTDFTAQPGNRMVQLFWANPPDADFAGVFLRYRTDGAYPVTETDGLPVADFKGLPGEPMKTNHTGLQNKVAYYYSAFTYDTQGNYSRTAKIIAVPDEEAGPATAAGSAGGCSIILPAGEKPPGPGEAAEWIVTVGAILLALIRKGMRHLN